MIESVMIFFGKIEKKLFFSAMRKISLAVLSIWRLIVLASSLSLSRVLATKKHLSFQIHVDRT